MPLTALKVRGKRNSAAQQKKKHRAHPYDRQASSSSEPTRPLRHRRPRKTSLLERQLPLEILEHIFYLSENVAFPRCSPLLGRLLSGRPTLLGAVIAAFAPTWHAGYGIDTRRALGFHWSRSLTAGERARCRAIEEGLHPGNPAFQSALVACRWADAATFLEAQAQWARRFAADRPPPAPLLALAEDDADDENGTWPTPLYRDVHPHMRIPDPLLAGPWSPQDALLLRWLRRGGARFHASQSWELKLRGLRAAVQAPPPFSSSSSSASASSSSAFRHDAALIHALCCEGDFLWDREDKTPRFSPATSKTASGDEPDARNNHAITDEWPRAVLAAELDRVYDVREAWRRGRGRREPDVLVRLCHLFETALGEHLAPGEQLDLQALTRL
ncbi:hypothetical protein VD0002_g6085 [Verticillium dahliae]|uniref:Uncharacterized protein n=2 Tax=Verticillium dahliae TaxID=27337 RepID=G2WW11_VERDV|nr:uncharacterized protein VDAG_01797 [Verticillium dahliae VdLs.17]KAH6706087.1 hypothetical protein EV126DRAFT_358254 [Verticillium dahliae]EGY19781.1 hypothetical protein VDAG_01797 [Verticillium dahliae VdLs.17]PNH32927.1 hypothetical protein BJF96_g3796 [Verticillium dahliae]PNH49947.1 hypothetical protein VD0003_g7225 [Verticillium dahliae]PNH61813.1 hypothetical protein VD0002_g6085 [Verticillium dahliae]